MFPPARSPQCRVDLLRGKPASILSSPAPADWPGTTHPEHACAKATLCFPVLKHQGRLARNGGQVEPILHEQSDIHIVRLSLGSDERSENHEAGQLPS